MLRNGQRASQNWRCAIKHSAWAKKRRAEKGADLDYQKRRNELRRRVTKKRAAILELEEYLAEED